MKVALALVCLAFAFPAFAADKPNYHPYSDNGYRADGRNVAKHPMIDEPAEGWCAPALLRAMISGGHATYGCPKTTKAQN